jgi:hypothetical protein
MGTLQFGCSIFLLIRVCNIFGLEEYHVDPNYILSHDLAKFNEQLFKSACINNINLYVNPLSTTKY